MSSWDAIVVGAGPAGSTCAGRLKQAGMRVKLFDRRQFPRVKPCAGWVTPQVIEALAIDVEDYRRDHVFQPISGFRTGVMGGRIVETRYDAPVSFGILRIEFDNWLLKRSGVECEFTAARRIERDGDRWRVNDDTAPLLIGAGGHFCPVARLLGARKGETEVGNGAGTNGGNGHAAARWTVVYAQEAEYPMTDRQAESGPVRADVPELYFCSDMRGYGWCFRKGGHLNVGLGRADKSDLSTHVQEFSQFLQDTGRLLDPPGGAFAGHAYQLYAGSPPRLFDDRVLLVGDAAGLAYPQSGEGIRPAIESAIIASDLLVHADGDYSRDTLAGYEVRLTGRLGRPPSLQPPRWIPASWLLSAAVRLMGTRWFTRNVLIEKWFLHRHQDTLRIATPAAEAAVR